MAVWCSVSGYVQVLHDAFFRFQTKPPMTRPGDLYYEGKEFEVKMKEKTPGQLSADLRSALGMADDLTPPPWLINMQRSVSKCSCESTPATHHSPLTTLGHELLYRRPCLIATSLLLTCVVVVLWLWL